MKNKTKQLLAFLMSLTLLVSGLTLPAGAADTKDESVKAAEKPEVMSEKAVEKDEEALGAERRSDSVKNWNRIIDFAREICYAESLDIEIKDDTKDADGEDRVWLKFKPLSDGTYTVISSKTALQDGDPYGYLFDEEGHRIGYDDDSAPSGDSCFLISSTLEAGKTYYIAASRYSTSNDASYSVKVFSQLLDLSYDRTVYCDKGDSVTAAIEASNSAYSYQWQVEKLNGDYEDIEGATTKQYQMDALVDTNLRCLVKNGSFTEAVYISIVVNVFDLQVSGEGRYQYGQTVELTTSGKTSDLDTPVEIRWQKNGITISENTVSANDVGAFEGSISVRPKGEENYTVTVSQGTDSDDAVIKVVGSSFDAGVISKYERRNIYSSVGLTPQIQPFNGAQLTYSYEWSLEFKGESVTDLSEYFNATDKESVAFRPDQVGTYDVHCKITSQQGEEKEIIYSVESVCGLEARGQDTVYIPQGGTTELKVTASTIVGTLHYQWYKGTFEDKNLIDGANQSTYRAKLTGDTSIYKCEVSTEYDSYVLDFRLIDSSFPIVRANTQEKAEEIHADQAMISEILYEGEYVYYKFVPQVTDTYAIYSFGTYESQTEGRIYDTGEELDETVSGYGYDGDTYDDVLIDGSFLIETVLKAGKTYYLRTGMSYDDTGKFAVIITGLNKKNISVGTIQLQQTSFTSDGSAKTPGVTVTFKGKTLKNGTDYTVAYQNNVNAGTATVVVTGKGTYYGTLKQTFTIAAAPAPATAPMGAKVTTGGATFKVTGKNEVAFTGVTNKKKTSITIPDTVKVKGIVCKVTSVDAKSLKGCKAKTVTLGKNVKKLGKKTFAKMDNLKTLKIKSTDLTSKGLPKNAFKGFKGNTIKVKKSKLKDYKAMFPKKGLPKNVKIKKL